MISYFPSLCYQHHHQEKHYHTQNASHCYFQRHHCHTFSFTSRFILFIHLCSIYWQNNAFSFVPIFSTCERMWVCIQIWLRCMSMHIVIIRSQRTIYSLEWYRHDNRAKQHAKMLACLPASLQSKQTNNRPIQCKWLNYVILGFLNVHHVITIISCRLAEAIEILQEQNVEGEKVRWKEWEIVLYTP